MIEIVPAILTNSSGEFKKMIRAVEPYFSSVHLDIADGVFVPNTTIKGINELKEIYTPLKITVHLMVSRPEDTFRQWLDTNVEALIFHAESTHQMDGLISETKAKSKKIGIAINPDTPIEAVMPFIGRVDFVNFMTVNPGFYGSKFREEVLGKIKAFRQKYADVEIRVDGGINIVTAKNVVDAGANVLVAGSYFFKQEQDISESLEKMKNFLS